MSHIAALQTNSSDDIDKNLQFVADSMRADNFQDVTLWVLPECFGFMQKYRAQLFHNAEVFGDGKIQDAISTLAKELKVWVIAGSVALKSENPVKVSNSQLVFDSSGSCVARYDKLFLFDVELASGERYCESDYTISGKHPYKVITTPVGKVGLSICYDLRFPELYRRLVDQGAEILVVPSAFSTTTGSVHWLPLLQARAIENACYVIAPGQTGIHAGGRKTWGHSMIINPWGTVIASLEKECGVCAAEVDLNALYSIRTQLPSLDHRRKDIFPV